uniref:non-specific serine/threonine protein kinase n=1 Tax=Arundo donax TaxID=35708 RepID=A0A0A8ZET5_ARUDO
MLDSGNFVLYDLKKQAIWSTFGSPTDTLLPGQDLPPGSQLFSSVSDINHATGKYRLFNQQDGNLVMYPVGAIDPDSSYWNTGTYGKGLLLTLSLDPNGTLWMFDQNTTYTNVLFLTNQSSNGSPDTDVYFRLTLDADGILRLYSHVFLRQGRELMTEVKWLKPSSDRCLVKGVCGPNSFCQVSAKGETSCSCLPGFEFLSTSQSGCWRMQGGGCTGNSSNDDIRPLATMVEVKNTSWSDNSFAVPPPTTSIEACKALCLSDCACEIAMFDSYCSKQMLPMRYGKMVPGSNTTLFVKVYTYEPTSV